MKAGNKPALRTDVTVGELVWFADRRNGRITEHLARVCAINADGTLGLMVTDQGIGKVHAKAPEWNDGVTFGWWKGKH